MATILIGMPNALDRAIDMDKAKHGIKSKSEMILRKLCKSYNLDYDAELLRDENNDENSN